MSSMARAVAVDLTEVPPVQLDCEEILEMSEQSSRAVVDIAELHDDRLVGVTREPAPAVLGYPISARFN